jgi:hypothetical protein
MPADPGEAASDDNSPGVLDETGELIDDDRVAEGSGTTAPDLKRYENLVRDLMEKARKAREEADRKLAEAKAASEKARSDRADALSLENAKQLRVEAAEAIKAAEAAEQLAREALRKLTLATSFRKTP